MSAAKVVTELIRELGVFEVTWEAVQSGAVSEIVFVVTAEDCATKNSGFLGYILERNRNGGKFLWKECSQKHLLDCQAFRFTYGAGKLNGIPIRNEEVIKTIGVTKWAIMKRKMDAVKELYNAEVDLERLLQEPKNNSPPKTSGTVLDALNSVQQKADSKSLKLPASWEKKLEDNNGCVKILVNELMLSLANTFSDLTTAPIGDDFQLCGEQSGLRNRFAVLMLRKDGITIRLRANPKTLVDPQKWIAEKTYSWYFNDGNGEEKEIKITQEEQIGYAMELLKQSYALAK